MTEHKYTKIAIKDIKPYARNAKIHTAAQIKQIAESIENFGFIAPLVIDENNNLLVGHGRLEAIKFLNKKRDLSKQIKEAPAILINNLSEKKKKTLILADNKIAENASWDIELLLSELLDIKDTDLNLFNLTGFDMDELDKIQCDFLKQTDEHTIEKTTPKPFSKLLFYIWCDFGDADFLEKIESIKENYNLDFKVLRIASEIDMDKISDEKN